MDLDHIDRTIRAVDQSRNTMYQGMFFVELMKDDPTKDFSWIEGRLRHLECRLLYLLAIPIVMLPPGFGVFEPFARFVPQFWVWHSVNGPDERLRTVQHFGLPIDEPTNLENLKLTGCLTPK